MLGFGVTASLAAVDGLGLALAAATGSSDREELPYQPRTVVTPDRLNVAIHDWGDPAKPPILFIHGFMSSSVCWMRQMTSSLAKDFRLVAYDWRGHGSSDKPNDRRFYAHGPRWADEIDAVIGALGLRRPILVGWSMAGEIIGDYLKYRGDGNISGINFVDAGALGFPTVGEASDQRSRAAAALTSMDGLASIAATEAFIRMCTATPLGPEDLAVWVALGNRVPWYVRKYMTSRPQHDLQPLLRALKVPVLVTHGGKDVVAGIDGSRRAATLIRDVTLSIYEEAGHASFWDASERFNDDLRKFASRAFGRA